MDGNIKGALAQINKSYHIIEHNGKTFSKSQLKAILEYGIKKGYELLSEFSDEEINQILNELKQENAKRISSKVQSGNARLLF
jgi:hypothetical protein